MNSKFVCSMCGRMFLSKEDLVQHIIEKDVHDVDTNDLVLRRPAIVQKSDNVNHPSHYTFGDIEVIDYIRDKLAPAEFQGYCEGNVLKYVSRWRHKGGVEDLKKAQIYLGWMIESAEGEKSE